MAASDNVLRGGLTPKHIDVPELLGVLDFTPVPVPYLHPSSPASGVSVYTPDVPDFVLVRVEGGAPDARYDIVGPAIAICTAGVVTITGGTSAVTVGRGESVYVTPDEGVLRFGGGGTLFVATTGA